MIDIHKLGGRMGNEMFRDAYIYAQYRDGKIPDIYLQREKYFEKYKDEIKARYRSGTDSWIHLSCVAIHVRRGDYVGNDFYVDLFKDGYYGRAMAEFPGGVFMVFSDDIEWCKNQEIFKDCEFSEGKGELEDMNNIMLCEGHIIANSSFSWWGAYLAPHTKKVVAPKVTNWFGDSKVRTELPSNWIQV